MTDEEQIEKIFELNKQIVQILKHKIAPRNAVISGFSLCGVVLNAIHEVVWSDDNEKAYGLICTAQMKRAIHEVQVLRTMIIDAIENSQKQEGE